jgi:hypothetical protein
MEIFTVQVAFRHFIWILLPLKKAIYHMTRLLAVGLLLLNSAFLMGQSKNTLAYNLREGQKFEITSQMNQKIRQEFMGESQQSTQNIRFINTYEVLAPRASGDYRIQIKYTGIRFSQETPFGDMYYDSSLDNEFNEPNPYALLLDKSFILVMSPSGKLVDVEGISELLAAMVEDLEEGEEDEEEEELMALLEAQFGGESMKNTLKSVMMEYPTGTLKKGQSFTWNYMLEMEFNMDIKATYTVKAISKTHIDLEVKATILADSQLEEDTEEVDEEGEAVNQKTLIKMKGTQNGTLRIDRETGMITSSKLLQDLGGNITVESEYMPEGISIPMSLITNSTIESKRIK